MSEGFGTRVRDAVATLAKAQKPPHGTAAYSRFINRPLGRRLAAVGYVLGLTPNGITGLSALCTFTGIALLIFVPASVPLAIGIALLFVLGYALDSADGQVARLTGKGSVRGEWLDHMVDCTKIATMHAAVLIQLYRFADVPAWTYLIPLVYGAAGSVLFFGQILTDQLRRNLGIGPSRTSGSLSIVRSLALLPGDYGTLCAVFVLLAWTPVFLVVYGLMALATAGLLLLASLRWWRMLAPANMPK